MNAKECRIWKDTADDKHKVKKIRIAREEDGVTWRSEEGEFRIWFPPEMDPLAPGDNVSTGGELTRQLRRRIQRGASAPDGDHYYYSIYLIERDKMVECESSPEMIVE
jgi:hypothetical protein